MTPLLSELLTLMRTCQGIAHDWRTSAGCIADVRAILAARFIVRTSRNPRRLA